MRHEGRSARSRDNFPASTRKDRHGRPPTDHLDHGRRRREGAAVRLREDRRTAAADPLDGTSRFAPAGPRHRQRRERPVSRQGPRRAQRARAADRYPRLRKAAFAREVGEVLDAARRGERFERLVLIALPKSPGELRQKIAPETRKRILAEIDKNLTDASPAELRRLLGSYMAV
jgi:protein required for attachment to host cells